MFRAQQLMDTQAVLDATKEYRQDSDRIGQFIEAWLDEGPELEELSSKVYSVYCHWCRDYNYNAENVKNFKTAMEKRFTYVRQRPKGGGEKTTLILGCKVRDEELGTETPDVAAFTSLPDEN